MINAYEANTIATKVVELDRVVEAICDTIELAAYRGEFNTRAMHDRKFTNAVGESLVAEQLTNLGFIVDQSDGVDNKINNFRTILISWETLGISQTNYEVVNLDRDVK